MAEYLAPGVYVEETSFRSKSIEGVSTSTTAFAGLTRKGPIGVTPNLVTSFGDFQRIYGGFGNLRLGGGDESLNYLAHSVRAYFENGGARLYISRVFDDGGAAGTGLARSSATGVRFEARFPGGAGNGTVRVSPVLSAATIRAMDRAPQGSLVRTGTSNSQTAATLIGAPMPIHLAASGTLFLQLGAAANLDFIVRGDAVEATAADPLAADPPIAADTTFVVSIDGGANQSIVISTAAGATAVSLVETINRGIAGGYARLTPERRIVIGSDAQGTSGRVRVSANAELGFDAETSATGEGGASTVPNRRRVTAADLNALFTAQNRGPADPDGLVASVDGTGRLVLSTTAVGTTARVAVRTGAGSLHAAFFPGRLEADFTAGTVADTGEGTTPLQYFVKTGNQWAGPTGPLSWAATRNPGLAPTDDGAELVLLNVTTIDGDGVEQPFEGLGLAPAHPAYIGNVLAAQPARQQAANENLFALVTAGADAFALRAALLPTNGVNVFTLAGGGDGAPPSAEAYRAALELFNRHEDISIVACPGASSFTTQHQAVQLALLSHCEQQRSYRIAVLDTERDVDIQGARTERSRLDSTYGALYYPWVIVSNPLQRSGDDTIPQEIALPPSGFVCGIYARTDVQRGVWKAPANEIVRGALRYDQDVNFAEQQVLNPLGINCLRFFPGRGNRVWGARTISSDPEWKYVNIRRYFNYLERSIDVSTQWAVFEPNNERLWANIRETIGNFLFSEWQQGALLGETAREAFFVRCDRSTMDQNALDNGRLICLIGVAAVKPAEFVIFRIGQKTADARS